MPGEHIGDLKRWVTELARKDGEGPFDRLNRAVELISKKFGVRTHEVAILGLTPDGQSLRFLAPQNLRTAGRIRISNAISLAALTVREKRPELVNRFADLPHASHFESVPLAREIPGQPIQKIMSSPIMFGSQTIGVVQVSRKGASPADAGPDFTESQLHELKTISDALAPCILFRVDA